MSKVDLHQNKQVDEFKGDTIVYEAPVLTRGFDTRNKSTSIPLAEQVVAQPPGSGQRYTVVSFFGFGSIFRTPVATIEDAQSALHGRLFGVEEIIRAINGNLALTIIDHKQQCAYFITDFFGGGKHFIWSAGEQWAISASLSDLVNFLKSEGIQITKSLESAALVGFVGYGGGAVPSSYANIQVSEQFEYIACLQSGRLAPSKLADTASILGLGTNSISNHNELLGATANSIKENVQDFSAYPTKHHVVQLTGGLDSRTVFAALVAAGLETTFSTYTYGLEESPDVQIARRLSAEYGASTTSYSGMRSVLAASEPDMQNHWSLEQTAGLSSVTPVSLGMLRDPNAVVLAGGWGEMYRGGYPDSPDKSANYEDKIQWMLNWVLRSGSPYHTSSISFGGLFSDTMVEQTRDYAHRILQEMDDLRIPDSFLPEWLYLRWSTRFNVAETTRVSSPFVHRADPLCSLNMMQLIFNTPLHDRRDGSLQLDLIRTLSSGMERLPFDKEYLTTKYQKSRAVGSLQKYGAKTTEHKVLEVGKPFLVKSQLARAQRPTEEDKKEALRVKMPLRFIVRAKSNQQRLQQYLQDHNAVMTEVFDTQKFNNLVTRKPRTRPEYRRLESLTSALDWYFSGT